MDGLLVPGGFGDRGIEGKIAAIQYAREQKIPFLGICLGMQLSVIEFARHVMGYTDANSREFDPLSEHIMIELMDEQCNVTDKGGTMRLGAYPCVLSKGSVVQKIYDGYKISERHRHRYEVNPAFFTALEEAGLYISGRSPDGKLAEMVEYREHPFFIACQFHPEFQSSPMSPHPIFISFIKASGQSKK